MVNFFLPNSVTVSKLLVLACLAGSFFFTWLFTKLLMKRLPVDGGRAFAVNGKLSQGKPRGAGVIFVIVHILMVILFLPFETELLIYMGLVFITMLAGYLDDASDKPWGELKKGLLDAVVAIGTGITYVCFNKPVVTIEILNDTFILPNWLYVILAVILIWVAINVTNCTDGVDGLSGTLAIITLVSFYTVFGRKTDIAGTYGNVAMSLALCILAYLWFNAKPSKLLMGDAGSRAIGFTFAVLAMKSGRPFLFIPFAIVFIIDGGLGLIKVSLLRFLKIRILKNTRTPIHDHVRKNKGWSDTQTVLRFASLAAAICILYLQIV